MPIYTVHGPLAKDAASPPADRIVFVRDGFSWAALVFGPFWLVWHRLWWALFGYVLLLIALSFVMAKLGLASDLRLMVNALLSLLMGLEGASLRRWTLSRGKWRQLSLVAAASQGAAEQRFFESWTQAPLGTEWHDRGAPPPPRTPTFYAPAPQGDIIGLFPQPVRAESGGAPR